VSSKRTALLVVGVLVLLAGIAYLVERSIITEEERLEAAWAALTESFESENGATMAALLHDSMTYKAQRNWVGDGDRDRALTKLAEYWGQSSDSRILTRELEALPGKPLGITKASGNLRFKYGESLAIWKFRAEVAWIDADGWRVRSIHITELSAGLF